MLFIILMGLGYRRGLTVQDTRINVAEGDDLLDHLQRRFFLAVQDSRQVPFAHVNAMGEFLIAPAEVTDQESEIF